ncbi:MAG: hypothetical protein Q4B54_01175 [Coriobacteriales bacterium]|nr:hypothetical protein [Coriobacteriales bacterium]
METSRRCGEAGQSSVEYAVVLLAFLSLVVALSCVWQAAHEGRLLDKAREASSHNCEGGVSVGLLQDLTAF